VNLDEGSRENSIQLAEKRSCVPGAKKIKLRVGLEYWEIPASALKMERPRTGPKPSKKTSKKQKAKAKN
jgi:hypothetical protein